MMQLRPYQRDLIYEINNSFKQGYKSPCIVLGCGGGKSVIAADIARRTTDKGNRVLFLVHRRELCEQIYDTFNVCGVNMNLCQIGMVQTITRCIKSTPAPALIITDENHHSLAESYRKIYEAFPKAYRIGVTATPVRLNGSGLGDINDKLIIGVSTKWLIDNKYLSPFEYYSPSVADLTGLHTKRGDYVISEVEQKLIKSKIFGDVISYYKKFADNKQAICYCASIVHSERTAEEFNNYGISAAHIDGNTPAIERSHIIQRFRDGEIKILCNVDLISEGFDVPDCEAAILLRPTKSLTLFIQQSMRCMRYKDGKTAVIIDHVGNYSRFGLPDMDREWSLETKTFKHKSESPEITVRQCPECFYTHEYGSICPSCGYVYPIKQRELIESKEVKLERITNIILDYTTPDDCKSMQELYAYAANKGYKKGWAYYKGKSMGLIS